MFMLVSWLGLTLPLLNAFFFSRRSRHTRYIGDWSSDVCSSDLTACTVADLGGAAGAAGRGGMAGAGIAALAAGPAGAPPFICSIRSVSGTSLRRCSHLSSARSEERRVGTEGESRASADARARTV